MENIYVMIIIITTTIVTLKGLNDRYFFKKHQFYVRSINAGQQYRLISSAFLHADIFHLAFNMIALYSFAPGVYNELGNITFILIYGISLVFGSLLTMVFYGNDNSYRAVGASGAVTGVIYSAILLNPDMMIGIFGVVPIPAYVFGVAYMLYSIYGMVDKSDNIGHSAHFGGAIAGYVITILKEPSLIYHHTSMVIILAIPIIILYIFVKLGKI